MKFRRSYGGRRSSRLNRQGGNDCVVRATHVFAGMPYDRAYEMWTHLCHGRDVIAGKKPRTMAVSQHGVESDLVVAFLRHVLHAREIRPLRGVTMRQAAYRGRSKVLYCLLEWDGVYHACVLEYGVLRDLSDCSRHSTGRPTRVWRAFYLT